MTIKIFTTGGTFDKIYYDAKSEFHFGDSMVPVLLEEANATFDFSLESIMQKDSLEMTETDRILIRDRVASVSSDRILIVHGTDGLVDTARFLLDIADKTIVMLGAMQPARMRSSDAGFNLGFASAAAQLLPAGVYVAMNGQIFDPREVRKNRQQSRFERETG